MNRVQDFGDWMSLSGGRRRPSGVATGARSAAGATAVEPNRGERGNAPQSASNSVSVGSAEQSAQRGWSRFGRGGNRRHSRPQPTETANAGLIDLVEAVRGLLFLGILATVIWLEWVAIKALAAYFSSFF